jgi:hypothetical protein
MPLNPPNSGRILLFGQDASLLEIRAMVLQSAGMTADIVVDIDEFRVRITAPSLLYDVVVCCHTVSEAERNEITKLSHGSRMNLITLEHLVGPTELIEQVSNLIKLKCSGFDGVRSERSQ